MEFGQMLVKILNYRVRLERYQKSYPVPNTRASDIGIPNTGIPA